MSAFMKGLVVSGLGLAGVFLVLLLFYITIRLLEKAGNKGAKN